jgi:hypothetical protein
LVWLGPSHTLEEAKARIEELAASHPGRYMVYDQCKGTKTYITVDNHLQSSPFKSA